MEYGSIYEELMFDIEWRLSDIGAMRLRDIDSKEKINPSKLYFASLKIKNPYIALALEFLWLDRLYLGQIKLGTLKFALISIIPFFISLLSHGVLINLLIIFSIGSAIIWFVMDIFSVMARTREYNDQILKDTIKYN